MHLRKLELFDAPLMLSWMHDENVTKNLRANFAAKTLADAEAFIYSSWEDTENVNLAIASDGDEYMGTVSLKHIENESAEFAITVRSEAMGRGYSWFGMQNILKMAFDEMRLSEVYWCVSKDNSRAIRFYDKHHFQETGVLSQAVLDRYADVPNLKWYHVYSGEKLA